MLKLAYLVTHPIQYQAPLLARIAREQDIDLTVFFRSDMSVRGYHDREFGQRIAWDIPLLEGYRYRFLPAVGRRDRISLFRPLNYRLLSELVDGKFDVLWVHGYALPYNFAAMIGAKARGLKVLVRDEVQEFGTPNVAWRNVVKRGYFKALDRLVDGYLTIGSKNEAFYQSQGISPQKMFRMPYAVDNAFFGERAAAAKKEEAALRAELALPDDALVFLFVAKLIGRKAPEHFVEAARRVLEQTAGSDRPIYFLLAGDGDMRASLEASVTPAHKEHIRFLGFVPQTQLPAFYSLADVFVLPSAYEQWGLVVNEALNADCAIVASDHVGSAADLVEHGRSGFVFPFGDLDALTSSLLRYCREPALSTAHAQRGRELVSACDFEADVAGLRRALDYVLPGAIARAADPSLIGAN